MSGWAVVDRVIQVAGDYHRYGTGCEAGGAQVSFPHMAGVPEQTGRLVGRAGELDRLEEALQATQPGVTTVAITGLGGVGKSALAAAFCRRQFEAGQVELVRWFTATDRDQLVGQLRAFAPAVGVAVEGLAAADALARLRRWCATTDRRWLLVFDDATDPAVLEGLRPTAGGGMVVVTSRCRHWPADILQLAVDRLQTEDAVTLLCERSGRPAGPAAVELVDKLGGLALAVQAGAFLRHSPEVGMAGYRRLLTESAGRLHQRDPAGAGGQAGREATVWGLWETSLAAAGGEARLAGDLLGVLAYLAPEPIPASLLDLGDDQEVPLGRWDRLDVVEARRALARYCLVDTDHTHAQLDLSVHPLVAELTRLHHSREAPPHTDAPTAVDNPWCATALALLAAAVPEATSEPARWETWRRLGPHVTTAARHARQCNLAWRRVSWLLSRYGSFLRHSGSVTAAITPLQQATTLNTRDLGAHHPDTLETKHSLAVAYWWAGRPQQAIELLEEVADRRDERLGPEHPDAVVTHRVLSCWYWWAGRPEGTIGLLEAAADRCRHILGPDHPDTVLAESTLGAAYQQTGRTDDAISLLEAVAGRCQSLFEPLHRVTGTTQRTLAMAYQEAGRSEEAIHLLEELADRCHQALGPDHLATLSSQGFLASCYQAGGRTQEAVRLLEETTRRCQHILGSDHPATLTSQRTLASCYQDAGRGEQAAAIHRQLDEHGNPEDILAPGAL